MVVDRQITRRIVVAHARTCSTSVVVLATEMVGNAAYRGKTIHLFCGASAPGETA